MTSIGRARVQKTRIENAQYNYEADHAGWLMACDAPKNVKKGKGIYDSLPIHFRRRAVRYRDKCLALYAEATPGSAHA